MSTPHIDTARHTIDDAHYAANCRSQLDATGVLVLKGFFTPEAVARVVEDSSPLETDAYYAASTHNVYLTPSDPDLPPDHVFNRQVESSKGLIADDQIPADSPLREVYEDPGFRRFLCGVLGVDQIYPYADSLSSINIHFAPEGRELGWHFDNSSFAVTMLLQAPEAGGDFQFVPATREAAAGDTAYRRVQAVLEGAESPQTLPINPGDLVLFRGRDALHRVRPTEGAVSRMLVVFAFNDQPGIALSESALRTFYGRVS